MGIDIGYTNSSLARSEMARCSFQRQDIVAVYIPPQDPDPYSALREQETYVNMARMKREEPSLYRRIVSELDRPTLLHPDVWYWNRPWFGKIYDDETVHPRIEPYKEVRPCPMIDLLRMPEQQASRLRGQTREEQRHSAWDVLRSEERLDICRPCPIRPLYEGTCYFRFSNYPGMDAVKQGFLLTVLYASSITQNNLERALFSFPQVDREADETPLVKILELLTICEGADVDKSPEKFFNQVVDFLDKELPDDLEREARRLNLEPVPFADEFLARLIYRDEPYSLEETREVLPYLDTLKETADWAICDTDDRGPRSRIIRFKNSLQSLLDALKIGDRYGLETYVSY